MDIEEEGEVEVEEEITWGDILLRNEEDHPGSDYTSHSVARNQVSNHTN